MTQTRRFWIVSLFLAAAWVAQVSPALEVPFLSSRVNDLAGLLGPDTEDRLEDKLEQLENTTGAQVAILTLASLEGEPVEDFALRVVEEWKLGREGIDDGVLLLISRDDRRLRIEVGYGLEPTLTDALSKRILSNLIVPRFREGDFEGGVVAAIDAIDGTVRGQEDLIPPGLKDSGVQGELASAPWVEKLMFLVIFGVVIGTFALVSIASSGCTGWFLYLFLMPFFYTFPAAVFGQVGGAVAVGIWVVAFPVLRIWMRSTGVGQTVRGWVPKSSGWSSGGWSSGGSGGGFSGGGFSGGGGSFGGGGASGSW